MKLRPGRGTALAAIIVLLAMSLLSPLKSLASGHAQFRSTATPSPTWTPTPQGTVLFEDDFATYSRRWREQKSAKAAIAYLDSALNMRIVSPGVSAWSVPDFTTELEENSLTVAAELNGGSRDSLFGFVLDYHDDEHFYALMVTQQGAWRFVQHEGDEWIDLTPSDAAPVERELDSTILRLRVDVTEGTFTLWVDDRLAGRVTVDDSRASGSGFGLIARAGRSFVDVSFDDMLVTGTRKAIRP